MPTSSTSKVFTRRHHLISDLLADLAADDADIDHDAAVSVVVGIEDKGAKDIVLGLFGGGRRDEDALEDLFDADACFCRAEDGIGVVSRPITSSICCLTLFDIGGGKIDFIDDRDEFPNCVREPDGRWRGFALERLAQHRRQEELLRKQKASGKLHR